MNLIIVGSIALDSVGTPFGSVADALGGSAVYASLAAKHFCLAHIVGVVGNDFPEKHLQMLEENNIDISGLQSEKGKTFRWKGFYNDFKQAETLDTQLNVFAGFDPVLPVDLREMEYLLLGNIAPSLQLKVLRQMKKPILTACDTMNFWIEGNKAELIEVFKKVDIVFINEDELRMFTNKRNIFQAADQFREYALKLLIIKQGEYGVSAIYNDNFYHLPIFPVKKIKDTTGAGDSFAGGFMGYIAGNKKFDKTEIKKALAFGSALASFNIEDFSVNKLMDISPDMIEHRVNRIRESVIF